MNQVSNRIKSFEGLKGFSVLMVILYHLFPSHVPGGFLMVNTFLLLGGYFFAYKMDHQQKNYQKTNFPLLGKYVLNTFQRLFLPLLWMMMMIVLGLALFKPIELHYIRNDILTGLSFTNNWYQILTEQTYFVKMTNATPFTHLWYNAIYLQSFILAIPLFLLTKWLKFSVPAKGIFWTIIVIISHVLALYLYLPGQDPSRVYYGLDTRFSSFALGMATAYSLPIILNYFHHIKVRKRFYSLAGILITAVCLLLVLKVEDTNPLTYQLVMSAFNILSMLLIWLITINPPLIRYFWGNPVFDFLGKRSYSYYLWYYPVIVFMMGQFRRFNGNMLIINSLSILFIILFSEFTYRMVEKPIIKIPLANQFSLSIFNDVKMKHGKWPEILSSYGLSILFLICLALFGWQTIESRNDKRVALFELEYKTYQFAPNLLEEPYPAEKGLIEVKNRLLDLDQNFSSALAGQEMTSDPAKVLLDQYKLSKNNEKLVKQMVNLKQEEIQAFLEKLNEAEEDLSYIEAFHPIVDENLSKEELYFATQVPMTLFGDSIVGINGINTLEVFTAGNYYGEGNLRIWDAIPVFQSMLRDNEVQENVVINLGTNGSMDRQSLDELIGLCGDRQVFFINTNSRVVHIDEVNTLIKEVAADYPNVHEIDWYTYSQGHPEWYQEDEVHHSIEGMEHFTVAIVKAMYQVLNNN